MGPRLQQAFYKGDEGAFMAKLEKQKDSNREDLDKLELKVDKLKAEIKSLEAEIAQLEADIAQLETEITKLET